MDLLLFTQLILEPEARFEQGITDTLTLPFDLRSRSRLRALLSSGEDVAITLPRATLMRGGSVLVSADGSRKARVLASDEELLEVRAADAFGLLRAAYHLGNRHVQLQVLPDCLRLPYDYVLADMVVQIGATALKVTAPFDPEPGAYSAGGHHHSDE